MKVGNCPYNAGCKCTDVCRMAPEPKERRKAMTRSRNYIGWVVIEEASPGYNPMVKVEYNSKADGKRHSKEMGYGGSGCIEAIEFFDMQAGQTVKLEPTIKGCYRVYIQEEESK